MDKYLERYHVDDIVDILNDPDESIHKSIYIRFCELQQRQPCWVQMILEDVYYEVPKWNRALLEAQKTIVSENKSRLKACHQIKVNCRVRFIDLSALQPTRKAPFPTYMDIGQLREIKASVVRMSQAKLLEKRRDFSCTRCVQNITLESDYEQMFIFDVPRKCKMGNCKGKLVPTHQNPPPEHCIHYQEITVQEIMGDKIIPASLVVTLECDLVDRCCPGERLTICGTIERRWKPDRQGTPCRAVVHMRAMSLIRDRAYFLSSKNGETTQEKEKSVWAEKLESSHELTMRDNILRSICPSVYGMYPVTEKTGWLQKMIKYFVMYTKG